jgi:predicted DNA-binding transcriptional regulator YafY
MSKIQDKRDRTARLLQLEIILWQHPNGLTAKDIAQKCDVSLKTAYRDLRALESELHVPVWEKGDKRGILEGHFLPAITFSLTDATNIFLATRLMQSYFSTFNLSIAFTFMKLNAMIPSPFKQQLQEIIDYDNQNKKIKNENLVDNFNKFINAWLTRYQVKIRYQEISGEEILDTIEPYFIEPISWWRTYFIIAYSHRDKIIRSFNIIQFVGEINLTPNTYEIPPSFDAMDYLSSSWSAVIEGKIEVVKLRFKHNFKGYIANASFHPSQIVEYQTDGSIIVTLKIRNTRDFQAWVLGWSDAVEVLEPETLRKQIIEDNISVLKIYNSKYKLSDYDLNDTQWKLIIPILPLPASTGRPRANQREVINGILWVLRNKKRWSDLPQKYGSYSTCHSRFQEWQKDGTWNRILQILLFNLSDCPY